jgi:ribosomal protein L32E
MWSVEWEDGFVVGGDGSRRLTPSFRLKEFRRPDGTVRVHRELVSGLQLLRDRFGKPLCVRRTEPDGLGAVVWADALNELMEAAEAVRAGRVFDRVERQDDGVRVRIEAVGNPRSIELAQSLETAFSVTAAFETAGDKFQQVTGNFDGAGLSFGPAQVNIGSGTLMPLFRTFKTADEAALRSCFTDADDYDDWLRVMDLPMSEQIEWANSVSTGRGGHDVMEPWRSYFQAVGRVDLFREIMVESILRTYGAKMARAISALQRLRLAIKIDHLRCMCSLYDLVVQQGSLDKAWPMIKERVERENPQDQFALTRIAVEERGRKAAAQWQADAVSRRVGILNGVPETVGDRQRANINFYLLRDVRVRGVAELLSGDMSTEFARVSHAVASGSTLLA